MSLWWTLQSMAAQGNDLQQSGLTQYMFDVIYVTWFVQLASLVWSKLWYLYLIVSARDSQSGWSHRASAERGWVNCASLHANRFRVMRPT